MGKASQQRMTGLNSLERIRRSSRRKLKERKKQAKLAAKRMELLLKASLGLRKS